MALRVWLPLLGNFKNHGAANIPAISLVSGNSWASSGKIGSQSLQITKQQSILGTSSCMTGKKQMSYAFWVKVNTAWSAQWLDGIAWYSTDGSNAAYSRQEFYTNCTRVGTWFSGSSLSGYVFTPGEWTHLAGTFDYTAGVAKFYINGVLQGTSTALSKTHSCRGDFYIGDSGIDIVENDIRIYDHCLSQAEIKELAQGLVLHYPLNRGGLGQENLLSRYVVPGQAGPTSTAAGGRTTWLGDYKITIPATENADTYFRLFTTKQLTANATYTISCQVSGLKDGSYYRFPLYAQNNTAMGVLNLDHNGLCSLTFTMTYGTQTAATGANGETVYICFMDDSVRSIASGQGAITVSNFKLEEGEVATPWCPNSSDALATTIGLNSTIEYDCSGYCNNLNKNGTYSYTSDTPKYTVSTKFTGAEWMNSVTPGIEIKTLACWAKTTRDKSTSQLMIADSTSSMCISFYSGCIIGVFGTTRSTGSKCTLNSSYKENDWNHFVVVKTGDNGERAIYCNGELLTPTSNDYWGSADGLFIGSRNNSGTLPFYGQMCDIRAYATALSADDVKSLYQNEAFIDSSGTIYGQIR